MISLQDWTPTRCETICREEKVDRPANLVPVLVETFDTSSSWVIRVAELVSTRVTNQGFSWRLSFVAWQNHRSPQAWRKRTWRCGILTITILGS